MSGKHHSNEQLSASKAQSLADRKLASKQKASKLQSKADSDAVPKHGL
ncbi:hypothetical protein [Paenibacillus oryzae]|nr:hypothetical protein [Paenibacillus oryzae]